MSRSQGRGLGRPPQRVLRALRPEPAGSRHRLGMLFPPGKEPSSTVQPVDDFGSRTVRRFVRDWRHPGASLGARVSGQLRRVTPRRELGRGGDQPARGRHRDHEHHAGKRGRAHARGGSPPRPRGPPEGRGRAISRREPLLTVTGGVLGSVLGLVGAALTQAFAGPCVHSTPKRGRASPSAAQTMQAVTGSGWREAPSCLGRRMSATAANLIERVLPPQSGQRPCRASAPAVGGARSVEKAPAPAQPQLVREAGTSSTRTGSS